MTGLIVLNVALAIAVVGAVVRLLSWAITSSRRDNLTVAVVAADRSATGQAEASRQGAERSRRHGGQLVHPYADSFAG